jgi:hypothetical protein
MLEKLKAMPTYFKVLLGVTFLFLIYMSARSGSGPLSHSSSESGEGDDVFGARTEHAAPNQETKDQLIAKFESQSAQLMSSAQECHDQSTAASQQAVMNGMMPSEAPCMQNYARWISQVALLQTYIARLKSGNMNITVCEANGNISGCQGLEASAPPSSYGERETSSNGDRETAATDDWDRGAIRGTSIYVDRYGERHELTTAPYYFEDTTHGTYVPSNSPTPPDNQENYVPMTQTH